jgi:outer membrane protein OmpA-like peptidoglycan-associated protein
MRYIYHSKFATFVVTSLFLVLAACSSTPERVPELEAARSTVERFELAPGAQEAASEKLALAREALARAETALANNEPLEQVRHDAYVARRQAEIGLQLTTEADARARLQEGESRRNELRLQARTVEAERAEMRAERSTAEAQRSARDADLSRSVADAALDEAARLALALEEMEAEQTERGMVLTLGDVLFDTGRAELTAGAMATMDRLAEFLRENPDHRLLIEGHTDSRGSDEYNRNLSADRARAVAGALSQRGISRDRLRTAGMGEAYPVASNNESAGRQQNRRVEIVVSDGDGNFPDAAEQRAMTQ